jgi:hypothetical protein
MMSISFPTVDFLGSRFFFVDNCLFYVDEEGNAQNFISDLTDLNVFFRRGGIRSISVTPENTLQVLFRNDDIFELRNGSNHWVREASDASIHTS